MRKQRSAPATSTVATADDAGLPTNNTEAQSTLSGIRASATARMADNAHSLAHTIADLESWRAEIDATIAFLKAQRR